MGSENAELQPSLPRRRTPWSRRTHTEPLTAGFWVTLPPGRLLEEPLSQQLLRVRGAGDGHRGVLLASLSFTLPRRTAFITAVFSLGGLLF